MYIFSEKVTFFFKKISKIEIEKFLLIYQIDQFITKTQCMLPINTYIGKQRKLLVQLAGIVEYTNCISAKG